MIIFRRCSCVLYGSIWFAFSLFWLARWLSMRPPLLSKSFEVGILEQGYAIVRDRSLLNLTNRQIQRQRLYAAQSLSLLQVNCSSQPVDTYHSYHHRRWLTQTRRCRSEQ